MADTKKDNKTKKTVAGKKKIAKNPQEPISSTTIEENEVVGAVPVVETTIEENNEITNATKDKVEEEKISDKEIKVKKTAAKINYDYTFLWNGVAMDA